MSRPDGVLLCLNFPRTALRLRGRGGEGGELAQNFLDAPSLSLQPKSNVSDFGQSMQGPNSGKLNPSSAASGGGDDVASPCV